MGGHAPLAPPDPASGYRPPAYMKNHRIAAMTLLVPMWTWVLFKMQAHGAVMFGFKEAFPDHDDEHHH